MGVKLVSASGGSVEINPPATASSFTATMPAGTGNVVVAGINSAITAATAQASTSGSSVEFTGVPSWVKRITLVFNGVSTNGTNNPIVQIGSGSFTTTGYLGGSQNYTTSGTSAATAANTGWPLQSTGSANLVYGSLTVTLITGNTWVIAGTYYANSVSMGLTNGSLALSGVLDRIRVTTADTFDAGTINILYE